jgi:predicted enzyme related to lactoylglutathione lyase
MKRTKKKFLKLNHLQITARDSAKSRDWYVSNFGYRVEFEIADIGFVALEDDWGMALLIAKGKPGKNAGAGVYLNFEVENVDERYEFMKSRGVKFVHPPKQTVWGYGPELRDPDGYVLRLFDSRSVSK